MEYELVIGPSGQILIGIFGWVVGIGVIFIVGLTLSWISIKILAGISKIMKEDEKD